MARLGNKLRSVGIARQTAYATENTTDGSFTYGVVECELPDTAQDAFDLMAAANTPGTYYAPATGSRKGSIKLKTYGFGLKRSYDPTTEEVGITSGVLHMHMLLLGLALGSNSDAITTDAEFLQGYGLFRPNFTASKTATYGNNDIASAASTSQFDVQAGNGADYQPGQLFACGSSASDTAPTVGWIKTIATDTITLAYAAANIAVANDDTWSTAVAALTVQQPVPFTLRIAGDQSTDKLALIGCQVDKVTLTAKAKEPLTIEFEISYAGLTYYNTGGGLKALTVKPQQSQPLIGGKGARVLIGVGGAALAATTIGEIVIEVANTSANVDSIGAADGTAERICVERRTAVKVAYPFDSSDPRTNGRTYWESAFEAGTDIALALESGILPGSGLALFMPALHQSAAPKMVDREGLKYEDLQLRPSQYEDDTGTTAPADTPVRFGVW